ncbi:MAG: hypothetical protein RLZ98_76 [Pseudomonadota bacterium]|jgi:drug/metabolite transporter (DMT)-like permease
MQDGDQQDNVRDRSVKSGVLSWWEGLAPNTRGAILVSLGAFTLVIMATLVKFLGQRLSSFEILFFRSFIGFLVILPIFLSNPMEPLRTKRMGLHTMRGLFGAAGNACFFWAITHMVLADATVLQFSRPLFMIPLALIFLSEMAGWRRTSIALVGFAGILIYARPFTDGFDPNAFIAAAGALFGGCVVICIKKLSETEPTRVIMFYYAFWNAVAAAIPTIFLWLTPTWPEFALLCLVGVLGIGGQALITHGFAQGDTTALVPLDYTRIPYTALIGYIVFSELPSQWSLVGMALIVASSFYLVQSETKKKSKK